MNTDPPGLTVTRVDHPDGVSYLSASLSMTLTRRVTAEDIRALARVLRPDTMTENYHNPLGLTGLTDTNGWEPSNSPLENWAPHQPARWESPTMNLTHHTCERRR